MHRFFVEPGALRPNSTLSIDSLAHQLHSVLRLKAGEHVTLLDDSGDEFPAQIDQIDARSALFSVGEPSPAATEPRLHLTLYQCSLKADKFEWVLQKGTELGVARFVPVVSSRSIVRPLEALARKAERWRAVIREAAEQSGRGRLPQLAAPLDLDDALQNAQGLRLFPWEEAGADVRLHMDTDSPAVSLLIGPEGGFSPAEADAARAAGWQVISLGSRTLRAETAALAGISALLALAGDLGSLASPFAPGGDG